MSINLHTKLKNDYSYKLIQLTPDLLKILTNKENRNSLQFKSVSRDLNNDDETNQNNDVVLCSDDKTWLMRQMNHSNTVLLMKEFIPDEAPDSDKVPLFGTNTAPNKDYLGFVRTTFEYETQLINNPLVNLNNIPIYNGEIEFPKKSEKLHIKDKKTILKNSLCSREEFDRRWTNIGGCRINGYMCILSSDFMSKVLHIVLMSIMAESLDTKNLTIKDIYNAVNKDINEDQENTKNNLYSKDVVETVIKKFSLMNIESKQETWRLNMKEIVMWYGINALKKYVSKKSMSQDEFLIKWKSLFPPYFPSEMDLQLLAGWYYRPSSNSIQYISKDILPNDIKDRFKMLFKLQSQWQQEDIVPFIEEFNTKNLKIDSFIMKFSRRKRIGNKFIISSR
ncbi:hypothetical protein TPHA_0B03700 [Tetrapisispora phaffii CBS 4417]|uniref:Sister chromatid cohesion protein DCC1 n=1 Tax=Tetrapisispora phaffii (strain ATCC 24235 / CBS 4417 / NBRC 1672 / NRRL Y-8282 / UCD 70-5) TaxID=1071381 RepID=G8BPW1_TETPH|nr:hypothetical protein TPHA_0B03700 [Tetrapisispora phaffii CBS 4417]CCE62042.1 hypothetical protein TPHA_0B03700 [Tetrapisispora phaffii CBS 4417]